MTAKKIMVSFISSFILLSLVITACSNKDSSANPDRSSTLSPSSNERTTSIPQTSAGLPTPSKNQSDSKTTAATGNLIRLKTISFIDEQGTGTEAFKLLVPSDWQHEGGVQWLLDNPAMPAISHFRIWNPKGTEQFEVFPSQAFFWSNNPLTSQLFLPGSKYYGNEVRPLETPAQALKDIVIPRFRPEAQGIKVINEQDISDLIPPSTLSQSFPSSTEAGKIRIEYTANGKNMEDEIYCVVQATHIPLQSLSGMTTNTMWGVNFIGSFRAEKGKLDASSKILKTISDSVTLNLEWFNKYVQVIEYLIKMNIQQIKSIGQLGSIIAQTGKEIRQENLDLYNEREATNDRISNQFSEYVRDVDSYFNPLEEKNVELPTGYDNVWVNNLGEYVLSDNPNYNPNVGNNQNYERLEKAKN